MSEFEKLVAKVMSTAFIGTPTPATQAKSLPAAKKKQHRLVRRVAERMSKEQQEILLLLMSGKVAVITIKGESYAYRRSDNGYVIRSLSDGEPEHTVYPDLSACSCPSSRFRGLVCKHIDALKEVLV